MITGIVAIAKNLAIGKDGKLPWHYSADLKFFKETTIGHAIVMGSRTWRSIGRALPDRTNIVLSQNRELALPEGVSRAATKDEILDLGAESDIFIIGGREIFNLFAGRIDRWIVTEVPMTIEDADTFMPDDFLNGFTLERSRDLDDGLVARFYTRLPQS